MTDDALLNFDKSSLADWDDSRATRLLAEQPALYRNHLTIAKWIDGWQGRMHVEDYPDQESQQGFLDGLSEIAAHLRQGDFVPGGALIDKD